MIESLYISKSRIRRELLSLFFTNPSKSFYLRELSRLLNCSAGSLQRELLRFKRDGLFLSERRGNLVFYSLNSAHPLHQEMKGIVTKTVGVVGSLAKLFRSMPQVQTAFIYGSFASDRENPASDIDVFVIGDIAWEELARPLRTIQQKLLRDVHPTLYSHKEYLDNKTAGSGFISDLLARPKIMLIGTEDDL